MKQTRDPDLPAIEDSAIDTTNKTGHKQDKAVRLNATAMCNLTMVFTTESLMGLIYAAITNDWLTGLTYMVIMAMHEKYSPKDLISKVKLRRELYVVLMKKDEDPAVLFKKISALENRYNTTSFQIGKEGMIATMLGKAPMEYSSVLTYE
eukprot:12104969-Ditylum_brightwellii.AAC.2